MSGSFGKMEFGMSRELMGIINLENKGAAGWSVWGLRTGEQKALDCMRCAVGHCDICATDLRCRAGLASRLRTGTTKNASNSWTMRWEGSYSGLSTCS